MKPAILVVDHDKRSLEILQRPRGNDGAHRVIRHISIVVAP
jgi:hypothetical protein